MPILTSEQHAALATVRDHKVVARLGALFADAGHELYLVGGPVRDALLGRLGNDLDFTTSARPDDIERLLKQVSRTTWDIGREFGTIGCAVGDGDGKLVIEITTFRSDAYSSDSRKPAVAFGDHLAGDLIRRDFTVNAMALSLPGGELLDPFGGVADLEERRIQTPSTPTTSTMLPGFGRCVGFSTSRWKIHGWVEFQAFLRRTRGRGSDMAGGVDAVFTANACIVAEEGE